MLVDDEKQEINLEWPNRNSHTLAHACTHTVVVISQHTYTTAHMIRNKQGPHYKTLRTEP